ncbi:MAG: UDP-glucose/GDP-mannose dehydrogenase family protein, partial [Chloroflexi bacterium]|nr:UDP-glucose/GDP-mannose dehydrogenase family protein [Chloroflexota bacterium]
IESAELIKHASNCFLALKVSYINAIANICERVGADVTRVAEGVGLDPRIGPAFLRAGTGYGGSCFPKDVAAFVRVAEEAGYHFDLLREVERINQGQRRLMVEKAKGALWTLRGKTIGVLGLAFKPDTDDIRESPAIAVIRLLQREGVQVRAYDPRAGDNARSVLEGVAFCVSPYEVAQGADALMVLTEWDEFKDLDLPRLRGLLRSPVIIDGRNLWPPSQMAQEGFQYYSVGR